MDDSQDIAALKRSVTLGYGSMSSLRETLYSRRTFDGIAVGERLFFFQEARGELRIDGTVVLPDETNLENAGSLSGGNMFELSEIDVDGIPVVALSRSVVRFVLDNRAYESGPLDIVRRLRGIGRFIDPLRMFYLELQFFDLSWATFPVTLRAELRGIRHRVIR